MSRQLKPRAPVVPAALSVTQLTSFPLLGIDGDRFMELLRGHPEVPVAKVGKLRVALLDDVRHLLRRIATSADEANVPAGNNRSDDADEGEDADPNDVLKAFGMRVAPNKGAA
jgi:hypothetical protein